MNFYLEKKIYTLYICTRFEDSDKILIYAKVAQLVEHDLAKVGVAGSNPVFRSWSLCEFKVYANSFFLKNSIMELNAAMVGLQILMDQFDPKEP